MNNKPSQTFYNDHFLLIDFRLQNWSLSYEGRVEIFQGHETNGSWYPVCADDLGEDEADKICMRLGFRY